MNKRFHILLVGLGTLLCASLCHAVAAAPPRAPVEKVYANTFPSCDEMVLAAGNLDSFELAAVLDRETVSYVVSESVAVARTAKRQAKLVGQGRTCRRVAVACSYRSKPVTCSSQRM